MKLTIEVKPIKAVRFTGTLTNEAGEVIATLKLGNANHVKKRLTLAGIEYLATLGVAGEIVESK